MVENQEFSYFNYLIEKDKLFEGIQGNILKIRNSFNERFSDEMLKVIKDNEINIISFGRQTGIFNKELDNLPEGIKVLNLSCYFDKSLDKLPSSLEVLILGYGFSGSLDNLPTNLRKLNIGECYNGSLVNLPRSLKELVIGNSYNGTLDNLPENLKELVIGNSYDGTLDNLPQGLERLLLGRKCGNKSLDYLPIGLKYIHFYEGNYVNSGISLDKLPDSIEEIEFKKKEHIYMTKLPESLRKVYYQFRQSDFRLLFQLTQKSMEQEIICNEIENYHIEVKSSKRYEIELSDVLDISQKNKSSRAAKRARIDSIFHFPENHEEMIRNIISSQPINWDNFSDYNLVRKNLII